MSDQTVDIYARVDDMHKMVLDVLPPGLLDLTDINTARAGINAMMDAMESPPLPEGMTIEDHMVPGHLEGDPDVLVRTYRPAGLDNNAPALFWMHGGGMVLLSVDNDDASCARRAVETNCVVASVEYRLAPETQAPGLVNDCYAGLKWLAESAGDLGIDPDRIAVGGASAGGGLAAGLALMARDQGGPNICFQFLVYPMLDHRNTTRSSQAIVDPRVWNRPSNLDAWKAYLGDNHGTDNISIYASPSIAPDLAGLPPAYINCGDLDMFCDEDIDYAKALMAAGVPVELHIYPGAFHGSNGFATESPLSQRWMADEDAAIVRAFGG